MLRDDQDVLHVVGLSGGKDSSCLALALQEREPRPYVYLCTPTGDELPDMVAHWKRLEELLGAPLIRVRSDKGGLNDLIAGYNSLPNWRQRWCTRELKIQPYERWLAEQTKLGPVVSYIGLRADEEDREGGDYSKVATATMRFPLREWGWGLAEVWAYLDERGVTIPKRTDCARCYGQRLSEWRDLWRDYPTLYAEAEAQEVATGHTFRSAGRDTWSASLAGLRQEFEAGRPLRERRDDRGKTCRVCSL